MIARIEVDYNSNLAESAYDIIRKPGKKEDTQNEGKGRYYEKLQCVGIVDAQHISEYFLPKQNSVLQ